LRNLNCTILIAIGSTKEKILILPIGTKQRGFSISTAGRNLYSKLLYTNLLLHKEDARFTKPNVNFRNVVIRTKEESLFKWVKH